MSQANAPAIPVVVLSYNICFQAMTNNPIKSAPILGAKCTFIPGSKLTICGNNMAQVIEAMPKSLNVSGFDFVGFQEASYYYEMTTAAPNTLGKMICIHSKEAKSYMASYYDGNKYSLTKKFFGDFSHGRPYHILVFKNKNNAGGTIFINAHNPHSYSYLLMQAHLGKTVEGQLSDEEKKYRIITVGDYNETSWDWHNRKMYSQTWTPFIDAGITTPVSITGKPVITCAEDGKWENADKEAGNMRGGDYVFDSQAPAVIQVPPKYTNDKYLSDHLPVVALLPT